MRGRWFYLVCVTFLGCADPKLSEVQAWMDEVRLNTPVIKPELDPPRAYRPYEYAAEGSVDPFSLSRIDRALSLPQPKSGVSGPDTDRKREDLEQYPLDAMSMVGSMRVEGKDLALLQIGKDVYPVRTGSHIGQNFGRVLKVTETEVHLRELVQDGAGEWTERMAVLQLQEGKKP